MEALIRLLNENPAVSAWRITEKGCTTCELYYVGHKLETNRATDTSVMEVLVYTDKDEFRGSAAFSAYPYMTEDILRDKISQAVFAASFAKNPYFDLPYPEAEGPLAFEDPSNMAGKDLSVLIEEIAESVFSVDTFPAGSLNATEFFLYREKEHIRNSNGVDVCRYATHGMIEIIPSWTEGEEEVEVMQMLRFSDFNPAELSAKVREELLLSKARCEAKPLTEVVAKCGGMMDEGSDLKIILQDMEVNEVLGYFAGDLNYSTKYDHANKHELGESVQGDSITGSKLNMKLVPILPGAMKSRAFDRDGVLLKETELIRDGVAQNRFGRYRYGQYLGEENPTGLIPVMVVETGEKAYEEMTREPYLRCVKFSGIQIDPFSEYFGGEVRLGFYFDGEKEIPVTGFAISGNLGQVKGSMIYSSDKQVSVAFSGPKYLEIKGMTAM